MEGDLQDRPLESSPSIEAQRWQHCSESLSKLSTLAPGLCSYSLI